MSPSDTSPRRPPRRPARTKQASRVILVGLALLAMLLIPVPANAHIGAPDLDGTGLTHLDRDPARDEIVLSDCLQVHHHDFHGDLVWISQLCPGSGLPAFTSEQASCTSWPVSGLTVLDCNGEVRTPEVGDTLCGASAAETNRVFDGQFASWSGQHWVQIGVCGELAALVLFAETVEDILASVDYRPADADLLRLYQAFFNRAPDAGGAVYWIALLRSGFTLEQVTEFFTLVPEFTNLYAGTSDRVFLERVYDNVLGRDFDQAGFNYWLGILESRSLSRGGVVFWVTQSAEFRATFPFAPITPTA